MRLFQFASAMALVSAFTLTSNVFASSADTSVLDPSNIEFKKEASSSLLARVLKEADEGKRYSGVVSFIEFYGPWVTLEGSETSPKIHISSYLLQSGSSDIAASLIKNGVIEGWMSYRFMDGVANDFIFALQGNHRDYLKSLFENVPRGLNTPFAVQLNGEKILPLALLATREYMEMPFYSDIVMSMLEAGANPNQKMTTGLSPLIIASSTNNMKFVRVVQSYNAGQTKSLKGLMTNTPLEDSELIEMQAIADTLIEQSSEKKASYKYDRLYTLWVQMILKGYNIPADIMYNELKTRPEFDINAKSGGGLTPLMAASLSTLYGGNVEYASLLIDRGAEPKVLIPVGEGDELVRVNLLQLALQKDNYKVVALMIAKGVNFISLPDHEDVLILSEAMEQRAYMSASIIKEALIQAVDYGKKE
tara:strand:- start:823 stop:2082 length:1260 start_codon:yes stop_codon:yes gene_type:complete